MFVPLTCIIVDLEADGRQEMSAFLGAHGASVLAQLPSVELLEPLLSQPEAPQLVTVNLDPNPYETLRAISPLVHRHPGVSFFVLSRVLEADLLMEAMHVGVREFIPLPIMEEKFIAGIERVAKLHGGAKRGRLIHVVPTTGGCGATTVACNVAVALAKSGSSALLDLDLVRGGVAGYFDLHPRYTIADLMDSAQRLDAVLLENALAVHPDSQVAVLARPEQMEDSGRVTQEGLMRLLNTLSGIYSYVVIDSMMSVSPLYSAVVQSAELNVLVMQLTIPSVKNAERYLGSLRRRGVDLGKVRLVINRYQKRSELEPAAVEKTLGMKIDWTIPNDFRSAIAAVNFGEPVVLRSPRAAMSESLQHLAGMLNGTKAAS